MDSGLTALIKKIRLIVPLSDADITLIDTLFQPWHLRKGDYFVQQGQVCHQVGFIQTGLVRYFVNQDGTKRFIASVWKMTLSVIMRAFFLSNPVEALFKRLKIQHYP